jgi:hypothetical protein
MFDSSFGPERSLSTFKGLAPQVGLDLGQAVAFAGPQVVTGDLPPAEGPGAKPESSPQAGQGQEGLRLGEIALEQSECGFTPFRRGRHCCLNEVFQPAHQAALLVQVVIGS